MSTVQDLINDIEPRIGEYPSVLWAVNLAIRTIAKRLFILKSGIIKTSFALTYAVEEDSKSFLTSYSGFWGLAGKPYQNGKQNKLIAVTNEVDILQYKPEVHDINQGALSYSTNDFIDAGQDFSDYTSGNYIYKLVVTNNDSTENWGYIGGTDGDTAAKIYTDRDFGTAGWYGTDPVAKTPLSYEVQTQAIGEPLYFELKGNDLHIYPSYTEEIIIYGDYFERPTKIEAVGATVPYNELFDDIIEEYIVRIVRSGFTGKSNKSDPILLQEFIYQAVDEVLAARSKTMPGGFSG